MTERAHLNLGVKCKGTSVFSKKQFIGSDFYIVPVSMIVAGAYYPDVSTKGGGTAVYFGEEAIKSSLGTWDGKPASLNHPPNGQSITKSEIFNNHWIGFIFSSSYEEENKRLVAELWLQESRSREVLARLMSGDEIDVSIGAFADLESDPGEANGVQYQYKLANITGDHLAVLPGAKGACSWDDGCGIRAKESIDSVIMENNDVLDLALIKTSARTPSYDGVEDISWGSVDKGLGLYYKGYLKSKGSEVSNGPFGLDNMEQSAKNWIASKSLLGDPKADNFRDLLFFPVVNPSTDKLNLGALRAVLSGRGSEAKISQETKDSAQSKAKSLLDKHSKKDGVSAMEESCVNEVEGEKDKVENKKITTKDILENKDGYCEGLIETLRLSAEERENLVKELEAKEVDGISLRRDFLEAASTKDLRDVKKIMDFKLAPEKKEDEVDFSLGAGAVSKEEVTHLAPKDIDWN